MKQEKPIESKTTSAVRIPCSDMLWCRDWAYGHKIDQRLPNKIEFQALQEAGYIPKKGKIDALEYDITCGHYGWKVDYKWGNISKQILSDMPPLTAAEMKAFQWDCFLHIPVSSKASIKVFKIGLINNNAIDKLIKMLEMAKESGHFQTP